jgi:hypothetical protein
MLRWIKSKATPIGKGKAGESSAYNVS